MGEDMVTKNIQSHRDLLQMGTAMYLTPTSSPHVVDELYTDPDRQMDTREERDEDDCNYENDIAPKRPPKPLPRKSSFGTDILPTVPPRQPIIRRTPEEQDLNQVVNDQNSGRKGKTFQYPNVDGMAVVKPNKRPPAHIPDVQRDDLYEPMENPDDTTSNHSSTSNLNSTRIIGDDEIVIRTATGAEITVQCRRKSEHFPVNVEKAKLSATTSANGRLQHDKKCTTPHKKPVKAVKASLDTKIKTTDGLKKAFANPLYNLRKGERDTDPLSEPCNKPAVSCSQDVPVTCTEDDGSRPLAGHKQYIKRLTIFDVCGVLKKLNLKEYVDKFQEWEISGEMLTMLSVDDMVKELSMKKLHALRLVNYIQSGHIPK